MTEGTGPTSVRESRRGPLARVVSGFLFGLGFSVATVGVVWLAATMARRVPGGGKEDAASWHKRLTPDARLTIESHESRSTRYNFIVLGTVRNGGTDSWDMVHLEVRLHDSQARVVGICRGRVDGPVRPTQLRYFKVDCDGTEREPVPEQAGYDVEIVDASYEREDDP